MPIASSGMPLVPGNGPQVVVEFAARAPVAPPVPLRVSMMRTGWKKLLEPSAASTRVVLSRLHPARAPAVDAFREYLCATRDARSRKDLERTREVRASISRVRTTRTDDLDERGRGPKRGSRCKAGGVSGVVLYGRPGSVPENDV